MTQEEKQLLLKDLCARLPYGVKVRLQGKPRIVFGVQETLIIIRARSEKGGWEWDEYDLEEWNIKPYLRPMSSMTDEEREELSCYENGIQRADFYYSHHIDCRFMIEKGLAIEAPEGMYKNE